MSFQSYAVAAHRRAPGSLHTLLATREGTTDWHVAELVGKKSAEGVQRLLNAAEWEGDRGRDDRRAPIVAHLEDPGAVLVRDETDFVQQGRHSVGVSRQYSGTAG